VYLCGTENSVAITWLIWENSFRGKRIEFSHFLPGSEKDKKIILNNPVNPV
jgi:hypothetical protein